MDLPPHQIHPGRLDSESESDEPAPAMIAGIQLMLAPSEVLPMSASARARVSFHCPSSCKMIV